MGSWLLACHVHVPKLLLHGRDLPQHARRQYASFRAGGPRRADVLYLVFQQQPASVECWFAVPGTTAMMLSLLELAEFEMGGCKKWVTGKTGGCGRMLGIRGIPMLRSGGMWRFVACLRMWFGGSGKAGRLHLAGYPTTLCIAMLAALHLGACMPSGPGLNTVVDWKPCQNEPPFWAVLHLVSVGGTSGTPGE
jgi:hypothetical protein